MRNARVMAVFQSVVALLAVIALAISLITTANQSDATRRQVCLYVNGLIDAFHTPQGQAAAVQIRIHYPALNKCRHH